MQKWRTSKALRKAERLLPHADMLEKTQQCGDGIIQARQNRADKAERELVKCVKRMSGMGRHWEHGGDSDQISSPLYMMSYTTNTNKQ